MNQRGFTLLEVLVATAILGIVMTTIYGTLTRTLMATKRAEERAELYASGRDQVMRMADEIESALPPSNQVYFVGEHKGSTPPADAIAFHRVVRRLQGAEHQAGGISYISYSLDPDPNGGPGLFVLRRHEELLANAADAQAGESGGLMEDAMPAAVMPVKYVLDRVAGLRFDYVDPDSGDIVEAWDTTVADSSNRLRGLPAAVRVTLFLADERGGIHDFGTIVDLPLAQYPVRQQ